MHILYLRTDICRDRVPLMAGGSVAHTLGVLHGFGVINSRLLIFSARRISSVAEQYACIKLRLPLWTYVFSRWKFWYLQWRLDAFYSSVSFFVQIIKNKETKKCTAIYQRYSILNCTGVLLKKYFRIPLILEYNGSEAYWFSPSRQEPWYIRWFAFQKISYFVERINLHDADRIVVVSQVLADDLVLKGIDTKKIIVNPNGVDQNIFNKDNLVMQKERLRSGFGLQGKYIFGFIGTFGHWHGINVLKEIIPPLVKKIENVHFLLIGDGVLKKDLEIYFQQLDLLHAVTFTGLIEQVQAPEYLAVCDAYLCPTQPNPDGTRFFGSPTKLFEYMSMGKPIIASDLEQVAEVVSPAFKVTGFTENLSVVTTQVGFTVNPLDTLGFTKACELCFSLSEQDRDKIGKNAREKVLQQYTWVQHVQKIINSMH